jgi:hypothetical protein
MRLRFLLTAGFVIPALCLFPYCPGVAGNARPPAQNAVAKPPAPAETPQIVTDEKAGIVRVLIAGREILRIDDSGLHVKGNIEYTGQLKDAGSKAP